VALPALAAEQGEVRRRVAVLEHRANVQRLARLAERLAATLEKTAAFVVIDPEEARRRMSDISAEVANCAGNTVCISRLGAELHADEVLLVGVSQLGDVVLALERIDVAHHSMGPRLAETLPADQGTR